MRTSVLILKAQPAVSLVCIWSDVTSSVSPSLLAEEDAEPTCEYCGNLLRPFPFSQDVPLSEDQEDKFCCKRSRELYEFIMKEKKRLEDASSLPRAVSTQESLSAEANLLLSKEQDSQRQQKRHLARELADQSLRLSATKVTAAMWAAPRWALPTLSAAQRPSLCPAGLQQAGSASYKPSQERTSPKGRTPAPPASAAKHEPWAKEKHKLELEPWPDEMPELESQPKEEPELESQPKEKPELEPRPEEELEEEPQPEEDYPSGNLAIIIAQATDQLMCIVQEDEPRTAKIRALFQSDGRSTCYYPSGDEWINMSMQGGQYLDQAGNRVRRWMWPNLLPEPQVPLSPIFISLNHYVGVRILAQDKIFVSFLAMGRQAKLNMGTKVQVSTDSQLPPPARLGEDELLLLAFRVKILQLFDRMRGCLTFPSSEQWNKMQPPMYLISQAVKILELSVTADISDELANSIKAIVNAQ
ncbi:hypothetical protein EK904_013899 [Melospiza melodia maxima]|nr:hypothetical protein EK904_013899 [Melospiza melodia maxima]